MNFRYRLIQFMSGRYGVDELFYVLGGIAVVLSFVNIFLRLWWLQFLVYAIMVFAIFRFLSRNTRARERENYAFRSLKTKCAQQIKVRRSRKADYNHVYKKCPRCKAVLRLPRKKGKHTTVCPKCSNKFKVYVFKA